MSTTLNTEAPLPPNVNEKGPTDTILFPVNVPLLVYTSGMVTVVVTSLPEKLIVLFDTVPPVADSNEVWVIEAAGTLTLYITPFKSDAKE